MGVGGNWEAALVVFGIICACVGWVTIEFILWLFSFISISVG